MRRRALILVENLSVPFDRRVWTEAKTLRDAGWRVSVISPIGDGARQWHEMIDGIEVFRYMLPIAGAGIAAHVAEYAVALPSTLMLALLARLQGRLDVVHACNPPDFFFPIGRLLRYTGAAFVFDQHDLGPELFVAQGGRRGGLVERVLHWAERRTYAAADSVIATNESYRQIALSRGRLDPDRVFVVRTSPDPARLFQVEPSPELRRGRRWLVVYVGTMGVQDGVDLFLKAAAHVAEHLPGQVTFAAIGSGDQLPSLRQFASYLKLADEVEFTGRVADAELRQYLATADVGVSPDPKNGFNELCTMNKTLEYMAMGVPIAAFDLKETRISADEAAAYATPNDPDDLGRTIIEILNDPARREAMGRIGKERIAGELSWKASSEQLLRAYETAITWRRAGR
jgi:glycosyltransferase involved in cell wall biosynthesis